MNRPAATARAFTCTLWLLALAAMLGACAGNLPPRIREAPPGDPQLAEVRAAQERFSGGAVRWGGIIARIENRPADTRLEVIGLPLERGGRPTDTDQSSGRFEAIVEGFLDPLLFAEGRLVTVAGRVTGTVTRPIGDYPYTFPVVAAELIHLWAPPREPHPYDYYDPFWDYGPWHPYPWRRYPYW